MNTYLSSELKQCKTGLCLFLSSHPPNRYRCYNGAIHIHIQIWSRSVLLWPPIYMFRKSWAAQIDTAYDIDSDHNFCVATDVEFHCKHPPDTHLLPICTSCHNKYSKKEIFQVFIEVNTSGIFSTLMAGIHISDASSTTFSESVC